MGYTTGDRYEILVQHLQELSSSSLIDLSPFYDFAGDRTLWRALRDVVEQGRRVAFYNGTSISGSSFKWSSVENSSLSAGLWINTTFPELSQTAISDDPDGEAGADSIQQILYGEDNIIREGETSFQDRQAQIEEDVALERLKTGIIESIEEKQEPFKTGVVEQYELHLKTNINPDIPQSLINYITDKLSYGGWGLVDIYNTNDGYVFRLNKHGSISVAAVVAIVIGVLILAGIIVISYTFIRTNDQEIEKQGQSSDIVNGAISELDKLYQDGIITKEQYADAKLQLLDFKGDIAGDGELSGVPFQDKALYIAAGVAVLAIIMGGRR